MRSVIAIVVLSLAACNTKTKQCEEARDKSLAVMERRSKEALGAEAADLKAKLQAQADDELAQFKANFVAACVKVENFDFACLDDLEHPSKACKEMLEPVWKQVYGVTR